MRVRCYRLGNYIRKYVWAKEAIGPACDLCNPMHRGRQRTGRLTLVLHVLANQ